MTTQHDVQIAILERCLQVIRGEEKFSEHRWPKCEADKLGRIFYSFFRKQR